MTDIERLKLFIRRAEELRASKLIQSGLKPDLSISHTANQVTAYFLNEPDEEYLRSFLLTYRQFVSQKEPIYMPKIYNLCHKQITDPKGRAFLAKARNDWMRLQKSTKLRLFFKGEEIPPAKVQDLWINGYYFHNDEQKNHRLQQLTDNFQAIFRHQFLAFVVESTRHIFYIASQLKYAFESGAIKV